MRPRARFRTVIVFLLFIAPLCFLSPARCAENISEANRAAFELKVKELLKTEFFEVVRGRAKPKPMRVNDAAEIQRVIKTANALFQSLTSDFLESGRVLDEVFSEVPPYISKEEALFLKEEITNRIRAGVLLQEKIKGAKTFYELRKLTELSRLHLMLMPLKIKLLKKIMRDFDLLSGKKASQFPGAYRGASVDYLKQIALRVKEPAEELSSFDAEIHMKEFIGFLAQLELRWLELSQTAVDGADEVPMQKGQYATATLRAQDGAVVVYGDEKSLSDVLEQFKKTPGVVFLARDAAAFIQEKNIPGIHGVEIFYADENRQSQILKDSVRSAELQDAFPLLEGLDAVDAKRLLKAFGYEAEVLEQCGGMTLDDVKNLLKDGGFQKFSRVVFLCGTDADSILFSVWQ